jgi:hypothetical protein
MITQLEALAVSAGGWAPRNPTSGLACPFAKHAGNVEATAFKVPVEMEQVGAGAR